MLVALAGCTGGEAATNADGGGTEREVPAEGGGSLLAHERDGGLTGA
jgi:hypothetical protein